MMNNPGRGKTIKRANGTQAGNIVPQSPIGGCVFSQALDVVHSHCAPHINLGQRALSQQSCHLLLTPVTVKLGA